MKKLGCFFLTLFIPIFLWTGSLFAEVSVVGGLTREMTVQPGQKLEGTIILRNPGVTPLQIKVAKYDYLFFADGRNIYGDPDSTPRSNAKWLSVSPTRLLIPPQKTASVHYSVLVPKDESLKGTYWSILMVEPIPESVPESINGEKGKVTVGIHTVVRYGIQMVTHIGNTGEKNLKILNRRLVRDPSGDSVLELDLESTGERWLRPEVWAELYNQSGELVGRFEGGRLRIYPGTSVRYRITFSGVPEGEYKALVVIDDGDEHVWGAQYRLRLP